MKVPIKDLLEEDFVDPKTLARAERRVLATLAEPPRRRSRAVLFAAAAILVVVGGLMSVLEDEPHSEPRARPRSPLLLQGGDVFGSIASLGSSERIDFDDASWLELAPRTELRVAHNDGSRISMTLDQGAAAFDVHPGGPREWSVDLGALVVRVTGTHFTVERSAESVAVGVERGSVEVRGPIVPGGRRSLRAGDRVEYELAPREPVSAEVDEPEAVEDDTPPEAAAPPASPPTPARWRELANDGAHGEAYGLLGEEGVRREVRRARSAVELLRLADVARLSGHPREAEEPLVRLMSDFPRSARAPLASFTLARLYQERLGQPADAAALYHRMLAGGTPPGLREPTMGRLIDAWVAAGRSGQAREAACGYLSAYPEGPSAPSARTRCPDSPAPR